MDHHLRFDLALGSVEQGRKKKSGEGEAKLSVEDFNTTVFIGNLPFIVNEEEVRSHFAQYGKIQNVRLVRDPKTYLGKGIGYIMYENKEELRQAIEKGNNSKFKGRELRVKKAVEPKRREKKAKRKQEALEERRRQRALRDAEPDRDDGKPLKALGDELSSDDSDDEKPKQKLPSQKLPPVVSLSDNKVGFGKKYESQDHELTLNNMVAFNRRKKH